MLIKVECYYHEIFGKLTFRALALRQSESSRLIFKTKFRVMMFHCPIDATPAQFLYKTRKFICINRWGLSRQVASESKGSLSISLRSQYILKEIWNSKFFPHHYLCFWIKKRDLRKCAIQIALSNLWKHKRAFNVFSPVICGALWYSNLE